jgi:hypothetical protein
VFPIGTEQIEFRELPMKNFLLLSAAYLSGPRLKGTGKENEALYPGVSKKKLRVAIVKATGGAGKPASGAVSRTQRKSPLNAGGKV